jgi:hypothetical protein
MLVANRPRSIARQALGEVPAGQLGLLLQGEQLVDESPGARLELEVLLGQAVHGALRVCEC